MKSVILSTNKNILIFILAFFFLVVFISLFPSTESFSHTIRKETILPADASHF